MAGRCWGLFLLPAAAAQLTATDFVPYYNYEGDLAVAGTVTVTTDGTSQTLAYSLTGTETACAGGANSSLANSCGVHIHSGTACDGDAGGHFYDDELVASDPWGSITYAGQFGSTVSGTTASVETGYDDAEGRTLIIHGYDGGRIACALLTAPTPAPSSPTPAPYALDWKFYMDPQELSVAAGTTVTFSWSGTHNVWEVPDAAALANCDLSGGSEVAPSSVQTFDVAAPDAPKTKYYVCQEPGHCDADQKIAITWAAPVVAPTAAPTPRPSVAATLAPTNSSDEPTQNIVELAQATDFLSTLVQAVVAADLVETLSGDGPFTVFAPTNDAFAALPNGTLASLLLPENQPQLIAILTYHVVPGKIMSTELSDGQEAATVQGDVVTITIADGTVKVNDATVSIPDIEATNGVVHVIDTVLIPPATPAPTPAPISGEFSSPVPTAAPAPAPTAESVVINSQLVLDQVTVDNETLESIVKTALVATLSYVTSTDQIVAFSVVSSRRRRLQQTTTVAFSVRVEGTAEFAASYTETIVSELSAAAQDGTLNTALATAGDAEGAVGPTAPADANDYDAINDATAVDGAPAPTARPTPQPVAPTPAPSRRPTPQPVRQPTRRPTPRPTAGSAGMEEEDGSEDQGEDQGEDESEDKGADSAGGGLAVLGIALAAFLGLLCVGGYVRMKMFGSQDRSDRDWARDLHGSGVSNPAAARDPWGRPTPSETRGVEMASTHGLRSYH
ncbi:unnamed protein product [Pelagomonas calceolata]|uniref:FAS1 domain-containing protein n=1 Tax=Pelagomonas calceolata TaxID=35677 RepID=A0A7S4A2R2_9STRA|nr:unnamed protein product [Pelagomonas calceolata]|mmetsp:Transcript_7794/g.21822  ORF Transcript_7794/g.21822 Transcript_7794/m.21822 type:complete len:733 (+) Transcript_7794:136-2334(+)